MAYPEPSDGISHEERSAQVWLDNDNGLVQEVSSENLSESAQCSEKTASFSKCHEAESDINDNKSVLPCQDRLSSESSSDSSDSPQTVISLDLANEDAYPSHVDCTFCNSPGPHRTPTSFPLYVDTTLANISFEQFIASSRFMNQYAHVPGYSVYRSISHEFLDPSISTPLCATADLSDENSQSVSTEDVANQLPQRLSPNCGSNDSLTNDTERDGAQTLSECNPLPNQSFQWSTPGSEYCQPLNASNNFAPVDHLNGSENEIAENVDYLNPQGSGDTPVLDELASPNEGTENVDYLNPQGGTSGLDELASPDEGTRNVDDLNPQGRGGTPVLDELASPNEGTENLDALNDCVIGTPHADDLGQPFDPGLSTQQLAYEQSNYQSDHQNAMDQYEQAPYYTYQGLAGQVPESFPVYWVQSQTQSAPIYFPQSLGSYYVTYPNPYQFWAQSGYQTIEPYQFQNMSQSFVPPHYQSSQQPQTMQGDNPYPNIFPYLSCSYSYPNVSAYY